MIGTPSPFWQMSTSEVLAYLEQQWATSPLITGGSINA